MPHSIQIAFRHQSLFLACICPRRGMLFLLQMRLIITLNAPSSTFLLVLTFTNHGKLRNSVNTQAHFHLLCVTGTSKGSKKQATELPIQILVGGLTFTGSLNWATLSDACYPAFRHGCPCHCLPPITLFRMVSLMQWPCGFLKGGTSNEFLLLSSPQEIPTVWS